MAGWLLGPEAFADFVSGQAPGTTNAVINWASTIDDPVYVTEITLAYVRSRALEERSPRHRESWLRVLDEQVPAEFGSRLLSISRLHLSRWSEIRLETGPSGKPLSLPESFDAAVCLVDRLGYVTRSDYLSPIIGMPTHAPW